MSGVSSHCSVMSSKSPSHNVTPTRSVALKSQLHTLETITLAITRPAAHPAGTHQTVILHGQIPLLQELHKSYARVCHRMVMEGCFVLDIKSSIP